MVKDIKTTRDERYAKAQSWESAHLHVRLKDWERCVYRIREGDGLAKYFKSADFQTLEDPIEVELNKCIQSLTKLDSDKLRKQIEKHQRKFYSNK
eukprot:CAMPEP_0196575018 /NCGR_PEP_ID=MMETSP1081-20130531/4596_1 /TAXON_ID=36882 /ORGANISM="Pyramimonas amylifera, Strain CCMP720" /LENGTH=94 /DNA_ID=CAMNT_0041893197 /DNA_START=369 /DNA_END=653 /DNA_ORIENTATION=+